MSRIRTMQAWKLRPLLAGCLALAFVSPLLAAPKEIIVHDARKAGGDANGVIIHDAAPPAGDAAPPAGDAAPPAGGATAPAATASTTRPKILLKQKPDPMGPNLFPKIAVFASPPYKGLIDNNGSGIADGGKVNVQVYIHNKGVATAPGGKLKTKIVIKRGGVKIIDEVLVEATPLEVKKVWAHQFPVTCPGRSNAIQIDVWADSEMGVAETSEDDNHEKYVVNVQVLQ